MNKHTPGEWKVKSTSVFANPSPDNGGNIICEAPIGFPYSMDNWKFNSKLIAAAPDLLRACQECVKVFDEAGIRADFLVNAIQKATA